MSHQVFERKWRCWVFLAARLSECPTYAAVLFCTARLGCRAFCTLPEVVWTLAGRLALVLWCSVMQSGERGSKVGRVSGPEKASTWMFCGPQLRRDHPPNLSILISGGRETNWDSPSSGERSGKSSSMQSLAMLPANCGHQRHLSSRLCCSKVDLERYAREGDSPVLGVVGCDIGCLHRVGLFGTAAQSWW